MVGTLELPGEGASSTPMSPNIYDSEFEFREHRGKGKGSERVGLTDRSPMKGDAVGENAREYPQKNHLETEAGVRSRQPREDERS